MLFKAREFRDYRDVVDSYIFSADANSPQISVNKAYFGYSENKEPLQKTSLLRGVNLRLSGRKREIMKGNIQNK